MHRFCLPLTLMCAACGAAACDSPGNAAATDAAWTDAGPAEHDGDAGPRPDAAAAAPLAARLPVEVLGPPGTARAVRLEVPEGAAVDAPATLELTLHNVVEPEAFYLRVNDGPRVDLGAEGSPFVQPAGGTARATLEVPAGQVQAGRNTITFSYNRQVEQAGAAVSGFRVLDLALHAGGGRIEAALPVADVADEPLLRDGPAALEDGKRFFAEVSRDGGPPCARCHADSGADLQYFGFSNRSIIERAMFHEFSREEAEAIASYIRSLSVEAVGTPFDPPFQPGPEAVGAEGAGLEAVLPSSEELLEELFDGGELPAELPWDWPAELDTFRLRTTVALPDWMRWLPRVLDDEIFEIRGGLLAERERALREDPSVDNADAFMAAAIDVGLELLFLDDSHARRIEVLRFAAVKLWDWSRKRGFDAPDHGFPDGAPAYPYEVGFGFFEAALADDDVPRAWEQALQWWWAQLVVHPGRGQTVDSRPLEFQDVLSVMEANELPAHAAFIHLFGSWEEARGPMADRFGTEQGPVRLLSVPVQMVEPATATMLWTRYLERERAHLQSGGTLTEGHRLLLRDAWDRSCARLTSSQRDRVRAAAPSDVDAEIRPCEEEEDR